MHVICKEHIPVFMPTTFEKLAGLMVRSIELDMLVLGSIPGVGGSFNPSIQLIFHRKYTLVLFTVRTSFTLWTGSELRIVHGAPMARFQWPSDAK